MTPEVNRLGVHYTNVSFANLFINADLWVDPYTYASSPSLAPSSLLLSLADPFPLPSPLSPIPLT